MPWVRIQASSGVDFSGCLRWRRHTERSTNGILPVFPQVFPGLLLLGMPQVSHFFMPFLSFRFFSGVSARSGCYQADSGVGEGEEDE